MLFSMSLTLFQAFSLVQNYSTLGVPRQVCQFQSAALAETPLQSGNQNSVATVRHTQRTSFILRIRCLTNRLRQPRLGAHF
jgi:hypothetical protein